MSDKENKESTDIMFQTILKINEKIDRNNEKIDRNNEILDRNNIKIDKNSEKIDKNNEKMDNYDQKMEEKTDYIIQNMVTKLTCEKNQELCNKKFIQKKREQRTKRIIAYTGLSGAILGGGGIAAIINIFFS